MHTISLVRGLNFVKIFNSEKESKSVEHDKKFMFCSPQEFEGGEEEGYTSGSGRNTRRQARSAVKAAPWETINLFTPKKLEKLNENKNNHYRGQNETECTTDQGIGW